MLGNRVLSCARLNLVDLAVIERVQRTRSLGGLLHMGMLPIKTGSEVKRL